MDINNTSDSQKNTLDLMIQVLNSTLKHKRISRKGENKLRKIYLPIRFQVMQREEELVKQLTQLNLDKEAKDRENDKTQSSKFFILLSNYIFFLFHSLFI